MIEESVNQIRIISPTGNNLQGHIAFPTGAEDRSSHGVLILHGFPSGDVPAAKAGSDMSSLADRITTQLGCVSLSVIFSGCGTSAGDFSLQQWVNDALLAIDYLLEEVKLEQLWICGFGTGGAVGLAAAVERETVHGVALLGSPADFDDWASNPEDLLSYAKTINAITTPGFPEDYAAWQAELREVRTVEAAAKAHNIPMLVMHGSEDSVVPHFDARFIADSHGDCDLRFIRGAGHALRQDPRAIAVLIGWLSRRQALISKL